MNCLTSAIFFIKTGLKVVLGQYELFTDRNIRYNLAWTIRKEDPLHEVCIRHRVRRLWEQ